MKTMNRHLLQSISAICLISSFSLASCSRIEDIPGEDPEIQQPVVNVISFTATLAPKGEDPMSKAITSGTEAGKEVLNVAWTAGEEIAVYYQKTDNSYATATATVGTPNPDGSAPITATLTDAKGGTAKFVYPATLANTTGDIDEAALLNQNGNLTGANGISTKFDAATSTGTIVVRESEATVSGTVSMANRVCICKFHFDIIESAGGGALSIEREFSPIIIRDGNGHTYTITSDRAGEYSGTRGFKRSDDIYIALLPVSGKTVSFYTKYSNHYLYTASGTTLTAGKFYRSLSIEMVKDESGQCNKYRDLRDGSITANDGDIIYQRVNTSTTDKTITIPDGYTVTLAGVNISATGSAGIICSGDATINLEGVNTVTTSAENYPAIQAGGSGKTLTIQGRGNVTAGGSHGAGIGTGDYGTCGNIFISGGTITATGGMLGAGIGTGDHGTCGNITISGGTITAIGGMQGAGIGSGDLGNCGDITIISGSVIANGGVSAAGIGSGIGDPNVGTCGDITINGGTITATGGINAAAIGSGCWSHCGAIIIENSVTRVTANKSAKAPGPYSIGKGFGNSAYASTCGTITIGGTVRSQEEFTGESFTYEP